MGTRSNYETLTRVVQAFAGQSVWRQVELARQVGVESRRLRQVLTELTATGMPLDREEEPPHVYWSVPKGWFPGGVVFEEKDWFVLVDAVTRVPDEHRRSTLLKRLVMGQRGNPTENIERLSRAVAATNLNAEQHALFLVFEEAVFRRSAVEMKYYSTTSGELAWRVVTPHRLWTQPQVRIAAYCHRHQALRWFRLSNVQRAMVAEKETYVDVEPAKLDLFVGASVDGYFDGSDRTYAFTVRKPEATWVRDNLLSGMLVDGEARPDEMRVTTNGAALVVARFVAGLGGAARAEGDELRSLVRAIAAETLETNQDGEVDRRLFSALHSARRMGPAGVPESD